MASGLDSDRVTPTRAEASGSLHPTAGARNGRAMAWECIRRIQEHSSVHEFVDCPLTAGEIGVIVSTAQRAPSAWNHQAYSIIGVTDPELKKELARLCGNQLHIAQCPVFFVFCADLHRLGRVHELSGSQLNKDYMDIFLEAVIDSAIACQNAMLAAESLGLGAVMIGAIRRNPERVAELLRLPPLVFGTVGLCVGHPAHVSPPKPRLPQRVVYHRGAYNGEDLAGAVAEYDQALMAFHRRGSDGAPNGSSWTAKVLARTREKGKCGLGEYLRRIGFSLE